MALPDVVIIGAGVVGAACAFYAAHAGLSVTVLDRGPIAGEATAAGQGSALASDKPPGPALDLAVESLRLWTDLGAELGAARLGLARTGALAVAATAAEQQSLTARVDRQRSAGMAADALAADELHAHEPLLARNLAGGVHYPGDLRMDPVRATAHLLRASGAEVRCGVEVTGLELDGGARVTGVRTARGDRLGCAAVVNAAGVRAGDVAALAGTRLPVTPRRGFVLITEALGAPAVRHTVYAAGYAGTVASGDDGTQVATVVTASRAGTVLIGASRERAGFDRSWPLPVLRRLAAQAVALFPYLADVAVVGAYRGFRPDTPDRLPIIGPDPWVPGLFHACGHEGAGICLAPATGQLTARFLASPRVPDAAAFDPERFG